MSRRLFIPLKREYFEQFEVGTKVEEFRPADSHFGRAQVGDDVVLSLGYGKARRLPGRVAWVRFDEQPHLLPGWTACYGNKHHRAVRIGIVIDRPGKEATR